MLQMSYFQFDYLNAADFRDIRRRMRHSIIHFRYPVFYRSFSAAIDTPTDAFPSRHDSSRYRLT